MTDGAKRRAVLARVLINVIILMDTGRGSIMLLMARLVSIPTIHGTLDDSRWDEREFSG